MLCYIKHVLYRLEKIKIVCESYRFIDAKLHQLTFKDPKFYTISYFIQYIKDYDSLVNYDIAYNKAAYKYFSKLFIIEQTKKSTSCKSGSIIYTLQI